MKEPEPEEDVQNVHEKYIFSKEKESSNKHPLMKRHTENVLGEIIVLRNMLRYVYCQRS